MVKRKGFREKNVRDDPDPMRGPEPVVNGMGGYRFTLNQRHSSWQEFKRAFRDKCKLEKNDPKTGRWASGFLRAIDGEHSGAVVDVPEGTQMLQWLRGTPGWEPSKTDGRYPVIAFRGERPYFAVEEEITFPRLALWDGPIVVTPVVNEAETIYGRFWGLAHVNGVPKYVQVLAGPLLLVIPLEKVSRANPEPVEPDVVYEAVEKARAKKEGELATPEGA